MILHVLMSSSEIGSLFESVSETSDISLESEEINLFSEEKEEPQKEEIKPSLFDDEVTPDHKTGALLRLDLPPLRGGAITPNAVKLDLVYPGDKKSFKVPLINYTMQNAKQDLDWVAPVSEKGRIILKRFNPEFYYLKQLRLWCRPPLRYLKDHPSSLRPSCLIFFR